VCGSVSQRAQQYLFSGEKERERREGKRERERERERLHPPPGERQQRVCSRVHGVALLQDQAKLFIGSMLRQPFIWGIFFLVIVIRPPQ
jgi:hypothetical protein